MKNKFVLLLFVLATSPLMFAQAHTVHVTATAPAVDSTHGAATAYKVFRGTVSGGPYTKIADTTVPSYDDSTVLEGNTYFYVMSAVNAGGESAQSAETKAVVNVTKPGAPTSMSCRFDLSTNPPSAACSTP